MVWITGQRQNRVVVSIERIWLLYFKSHSPKFVSSTYHIANLVFDKITYNIIYKYNKFISIIHYSDIARDLTCEDVWRTVDRVSVAGSGWLTS